MNENNNTTPPTTAYRGVTFERGSNKWRARIYHRGKHVTLGRYACPVKAAHAHDRAAYYVYGEGAITNFGLRAARDALDKNPPAESERAMLHLRKMASEVESNHARRKQAAIQSGVMVMLGEQQGSEDDARRGAVASKDSLLLGFSGEACSPTMMMTMMAAAAAAPKRRRRGGLMAVPSSSSSSAASSIDAAVASTLRALVYAALGIDSAMPRARGRYKGRGGGGGDDDDDDANAAKDGARETAAAAP